MHLDVLDLKSFYYRTRLGRAAQKAIREQVRLLWPEAKGQTVAGYGFAVPLLRPYLEEARRVIGLMPAPQGVMPWPQGQANVSVLCEETWWPLETGRVDKMILLHGLETSENPNAVLAETARVLGPGGKALFIVPNRAGLWSRSDATPMGFGRPYSLSQLETQLKTAGFLPERHVAALFQPPSHRRFWLKAGPTWERIGRRVSNHLAGGVLLVEATKQVRAERPKGTPVSAKTRLGVLEGMGKPAPKPA